METKVYAPTYAKNRMTPLPFLILSIVLVIASASDLLFHKIPNWLTYPAMIVGVLYGTHLKGLGGSLYSILGISIGMTVLIIPFLAGGMGAGDVKLMGAVGGFLGPRGVWIAFLFTAWIGGIYALVLLASKGQLRRTGERYLALLRSLISIQGFSRSPSSNRWETPRLRYGLAIALGAFISILLGME